MLDIQFIRDNAEKVIKATIDKGFDGSAIDKLLQIDIERRKLIQEVENLRAKRNTFTKDNIEEAKRLKVELKEKEEAQNKIDIEFRDLMLKVPNPSAADVKVGTPDDNEVIKQVG